LRDSTFALRCAFDSCVTDTARLLYRLQRHISRQSLATWN